MTDGAQYGRARTGGGIILVLNCGSSSVKFALFEVNGVQVSRRPLWSGKIESLGSAKTT